MDFEAQRPVKSRVAKFPSTRFNNLRDRLGLDVDTAKDAQRQFAYDYRCSNVSHQLVFLLSQLISVGTKAIL